MVSALQLLLFKTNQYTTKHCSDMIEPFLYVGYSKQLFSPTALLNVELYRPALYACDVMYTFVHLGYLHFLALLTDW